MIEMIRQMWTFVVDNYYRDPLGLRGGCMNKLASRYKACQSMAGGNSMGDNDF